MVCPEDCFEKGALACSYGKNPEDTASCSKFEAFTIVYIVQSGLHFLPLLYCLYNLYLHLGISARGLRATGTMITTGFMFSQWLFNVAECVLLKENAKAGSQVLFGKLATNLLIGVTNFLTVFLFLQMLSFWLTLVDVTKMMGQKSGTMNKVKSFRFLLLLIGFALEFTYRVLRAVLANVPFFLVAIYNLYTVSLVFIITIPLIRYSRKLKKDFSSTSSLTSSSMNNGVSDKKKAYTASVSGIVSTASVVGILIIVASVAYTAVGFAQGYSAISHTIYVCVVDQGKVLVHILVAKMYRPYVGHFQKKRVVNITRRKSQVSRLLLFPLGLETDAHTEASGVDVKEEGTVANTQEKEEGVRFAQDGPRAVMIPERPPLIEKKSQSEKNQSEKNQSEKSQLEKNQLEKNQTEKDQLEKNEIEIEKNNNENKDDNRQKHNNENENHNDNRNESQNRENEKENQSENFGGKNIDQSDVRIDVSLDEERDQERERDQEKERDQERERDGERERDQERERDEERDEERESQRVQDRESRDRSRTASRSRSPHEERERREVMESEREARERDEERSFSRHGSDRGPQASRSASPRRSLSRSASRSPPRSSRSRSP